MTNNSFWADNMSLMPLIETKKFDLAKVDPPYFSGPEKRNYYGSSVSTTKVKRRFYSIEKTWELPTETHFEEIKRISKNQIVWGANYFEYFGEPFKTPRRENIQEFMESHPTGWIIWDKVNGKSSFNDYELAWSSYNEPTYIYQFMWNGFMQGKSMTEGHIQQGNKKLNQKRIHPTEKPILWYKYFFNRYLEKGQSVIDPYLRGGSCRIPAYELGINLTGIELNESMYKKQDARFLEWKESYDLFNKINPKFI